MNPLLTIGMATFQDFNGVYFTIQSLRLHHPEVMDRVEFLVVDNSPNTPEGQTTKDFVEGHCGQGNLGARYVGKDHPKGTSFSRNQVFEHARGEYVLCVDCHVLFQPGSIARLLDYLAVGEHPDLLSGPLVLDDLNNITTHFNLQWNAEMYGTWGLAWGLRNEDKEFYGLFSVVNRENHCHFVALDAQMTPLTATVAGDLPKNLPWSGHDAKLLELGFQPVGMRPSDPPFEIPAMGLGTFCAHREGWLGFNEHAIGFGGEEGYIHEKYRQAGHRTLCVPFLRWVHRFGRPQGVPYPLTRWNKVRNYILEWKELGWDLDDIHDHFVTQVGFPQAQYDHLVKNPIAHIVFGAVIPDEDEECNGCGAKSLKGDTVEAIFNQLKTIPRDLNQHMDKLRELAASVSGDVAEFTHRREITVALAAGVAGSSRTVLSWNTEKDPVYDKLKGLGINIQVLHELPAPGKALALVSPKGVDLLFIDTKHTHQRLKWELETFHGDVNRYIVLHDTVLHGEKGEDGGPGLLAALREFMTEHPEWAVVYHALHQYGLTVISKSPEDRPALPPIAKMAWTYLESVAKHIGSGSQIVTEEVAKIRLGTCSMCQMRNEERCAACGCFLAESPTGGPGKALMTAMACPLGFWAEAETKGQPVVPLILKEVAK